MSRSPAPVTPVDPHEIVSGTGGKRVGPPPLSSASEAALLAGLIAYTDRQTELFGA